MKKKNPTELDLRIRRAKLIAIVIVFSAAAIFILIKKPKDNEYAQEQHNVSRIMDMQLDSIMRTDTTKGKMKLISAAEPSVIRLETKESERRRLQRMKESIDSDGILDARETATDREDSIVYLRKIRYCIDEIEFIAMQKTDDQFHRSEIVSRYTVKKRDEIGSKDKLIEKELQEQADDTNTTID